MEKYSKINLNNTSEDQNLNNKSNKENPKIIIPGINNTQQKFNKKPKTLRNPGIDLLRIISMYFIIVNHFLYFANGYNRFSKHNRQLTMLHTFTAWHINGFMLISGIVGYKSYKYANLLYLWLIVFFYSVGIHKYVKYFKKGFYINNQEAYKEYYPMIFRKYWYFTAYFGMCLFLPVINKGVEYLTKSELKLVVISMISIFVFWEDYKNPTEDVFKLHGGMSVLWLLIFYIIGAYIGKYRVDYSGYKKYIYCIICILFYVISSYIYFKVVINELNFGNGRYQLEIANMLKRTFTLRYDSLSKVIQSISVCLFLLQINYNKYIAKIICFFGPLIFGVYLIHMNIFFEKKILPRVFDNIPRDINLKSLLGFLFFKSIKLFMFCTVIDFFRHLLFSLLRIKKIFIFCENKLKKIFF